MVNITSDKVFWGLIFLLVIGLAVNFDNNLGYLFGMILGGIGLFRILDIKRKTIFPIERTRNLKKSFVLAISGLIATYTLSVIFLGIFKGPLGLETITLETIFQYFAQQSLIFAGSVFLMFIAFVFIVAPTETWLQAIIMDFLRDIKNTNLKKLSVASVLIFLITVSGFVFLHFNAKGMRAEALVPVAVFFAVSYFIILIEGQLLAAILMHMINNAIAIAVSTGWISTITLTGPIMIGIVVAILLYLLFRTKLLIRPIIGG